MKKILAILVMVLFAAYPAVSQASSGHGAPVEVSGVIVLQHIMSSDADVGTGSAGTQGDDNTDAYKIYLNFDKQITEGIKTHITINADKFGAQDGSANDTDSAALEEAQIIFTGVAGNDITIVTGKQEAPFGQDYSQFILGTHTHHQEVDKVWGVGAVVGIEGMGSVTAAVANTDDREDDDVSLTDTTAFKIKADKMVDGLSLEASMISLAGTAAEKDHEQTSIAAKYNTGDLTLAAEQTKVKNRGYAESAEDEVTNSFAADYKIGNILLKANYEDLSNEVTHHHIDKIVMYGANYEFTDGVYATIETQAVDHESGNESYDYDQVLVGLYAHF